MKAGSQFLDRHEVAKLVSTLKADILKYWEKLSREKVAAAEKQSHLALRDSLPEFLDQLELTLKSNDPNEQAASNAKVAKEHGEDRAKQPEYTLEEVIFEYHILRAVIIDHLEAKAELASEPQKIIHEFIDRGIGKAAATFAELEANQQAIRAREFEEAKVVAETSNQAKSAFLANMSHEIRTPLGAIMGFVGLLKDKGLSEEEILNYHTIIDRNSNHLLRIIDDILDLAKVEAGKIILEKIEFSLTEFLAEFASLANLKAREKGIIFKYTRQTSLPEHIISDPTRLRQVLSNIVGNAIKFTEKGSVELSVYYTEQGLRFCVVDTGRGIAAEQRAQLFQAFSQADSSTTRKFGGTGLGLVLTKKLSQTFGGDFQLIESRIGKGSFFEAKIPVTVPSHSKILTDANVAVAVPTSSGVDPYQVDLAGFQILLVEDSPDNQYLVQKMLSKTGAEITIVSNGDEGVKSALAKQFDVILMDIQMPIMDGHEAIRILRSRDYMGPVVALTAHAMNEERKLALKSGFSHFLSKPIIRKDLIDLLKTIHNAGKS